jgi:hypothetical protein
MDYFRPGQHNRTLQKISGQESRNAFGPANYNPGIFPARHTKIKQELLLAWPKSEVFPGNYKNQVLLPSWQKYNPEYFLTCQHKGPGLLPTWRKSCPGMFLAMQASTKIKDCFRLGEQARTKIKVCFRPG